MTSVPSAFGWSQFWRRVLSRAEVRCLCLLSTIVISKEDIKSVFGDIEVLLGVNMMLVSMLDAKVAQAKRDPGKHTAFVMIGEVFSKIVCLAASARSWGAFD